VLIGSSRYFSIFKPIQAVKTKGGEKESDMLSYLANPFIDILVLEPLFAIDASIHVLNALASLAKALYTWSINQQTTKGLVDEETQNELNDSLSSISHAGSMLIAQTLNSVFSFISLFTRPMASIGQAVVDYNEESPKTTFQCM
jgi:hypothetical protein